MHTHFGTGGFALECGDSSPLWTPKTREESGDSSPLWIPKAREESGDESPHSKAGRERLDSFVNFLAAWHCICSVGESGLATPDCRMLGELEKVGRKEQEDS